MGEQIIFYRMSKADFANDNITATASQGNDYAAYPLNRSNESAWVTTTSVDADNTTWEVDWADPKTVDNIILVGHNFKSYNVKYWNGAAYVAFSPAIVETVNTVSTNSYEVTEVETTKIQIEILGTQVADADKYLRQFIATEKIGQLASWPVMKPVLGRNRKSSKMLSGKQSIRESVGNYDLALAVKILSIADDLEIIEDLYYSNSGFLVYPCGGNESQFKSVRRGYRLEDIFLMKCADEWKPVYNTGIYVNGMKISIKLKEVV